MDGKIIQVPYGVISQKSDPENELQFNFLPNFRKDILFDKLLYLTESKNPTLNNIIKNDVVGNLELQKYILATDLLQDSVQQSLDMIVTDGGFNDAAVRRELDLKYPSILKKPNPVDVVFEDKAKFDVQNLIIGSLVAQVQENKTNEKATLNQISGAPSTKDIELAEHLAKLRGEKKNDNNNNENSNNNGNNFPPFLCSLPQPPTPPSSPPDGGDGESDYDDENRNLTPTQRFLLDQPQRTAVAVGANNAATSMPLQKKAVRFSENLSKVFPEANDISELDDQPKILEKEEITVSNVQSTIKKLNEGKLSEKLKFFSGEEKEENLLETQARKNVGVLSKGNEEFLEYLASKYGRDVLQKDKLKIHLGSGEIYQDNINTGIFLKSAKTGF